MVDQREMTAETGKVCYGNTKEVKTGRQVTRTKEK